MRRSRVRWAANKPAPSSQPATDSASGRFSPCHGAMAPSCVGPAVCAYDCSSGSSRVGHTPRTRPSSTSTRIGPVIHGDDRVGTVAGTGAAGVPLSAKAPHIAANVVIVASPGRLCRSPDSFVRSRVPVLVSITPTAKNSGALKVACAISIAIPPSSASGLPHPISSVIRPSCETVP